MVPLSLALLLGAPRPAAWADDSLDYRYVDYSENGGRMRIDTQVLAASQALGPDTEFGVTLTNDAIAGASPTGAQAPVGSGQVPLAYLSDHRKEWEVDLAQQIDRVNVSAGYSESREHDYVSRGGSLNTLTDFFEKDTTILAGFASHDDDVKTYVNPLRPYQPKHVVSAILGVRQVLDPKTFVTFNVTWSRENGYLDDQYKIVEKIEELSPGSFFPLGFLENVPDAKDSGVAYLAVNRAMPGLRAAVEASYRYYADTFGVHANTFELQWLQKIGSRVTLAPDLRLYEQRAARFYYYNLDDTDIFPTHVPNPDGPNYSSDYRLSSLDAVTWGLKFTGDVCAHFQVTLAYDRYAMHGRDGVTPQSAYPTANIVSVGGKISW